jgi:hypothetical protein
MMQDILFIGLLLLQFGVTLFLIWWIVSHDIDVDEVHERFDDMQQGLEVLSTVLSRLPEIIPSLTLQTSPFQSIIDVIAERMKTRADSNPAPLLRDDTGRFTDGEEEDEIPT